MMVDDVCAVTLDGDGLPMVPIGSVRGCGRTRRTG